MSKKKSENPMAEDDLTKEVLDHVKNGTESTDEEKQEQARALLRAFEQWETIKNFSARERKRCNENVKAKAEDLKTALEETTTNKTEQLSKLGRAEIAWQDLEEAKAEQKDIRNSTRDNIKDAEQKIRDLLEEQKQLGLEF